MTVKKKAAKQTRASVAKKKVPAKTVTKAPAKKAPTIEDLEKDLERLLTTEDLEKDLERLLAKTRELKKTIASVQKKALHFAVIRGGRSCKEIIGRLRKETQDTPGTSGTGPRERQARWRDR